MDTYLLIILYLSCVLGMSFASNLTVLSGHLGDTFSIGCPYSDRRDRWRKKLWCKEDKFGQCHDVVVMHSFWTPYEKNGNNFTNISDNTRAGIVTVNITLVQKEDEGIYQCQSRSFTETKVRVLQRVLVKVLEDPKSSIFDLIDYSTSRIPVGSQVAMTWAIIGSGLLLFKLLVMGLMWYWWRSQQNLRVGPESPLTSAIEESVPDEEINVYVFDEERYVYEAEALSITPLYTNYAPMKEHLNKAYCQR
ncbi:triggering receptor expressed on myeloid cells 2-like [Pelobates fuscus]|uniref:triggering receptor expressed on myeloid cells 2-like n=1 Tax=Pelobates fuscus TaxID=191477 RepID=UPI002FE4FA3D